MKPIAMVLLILFAGTAVAEGVDVHVVVYLPPEISALSAAEFRVDNLPIGPCSIEAEWNTSLVIGEVDTGISLAFSPFLTGYTVHLGTLHITCFEPLEDNYRICVYPHYDTGQLIIVDENYDTIDADGLAHRFNTSYPEWCYCYEGASGRERNTPVFGLIYDLDYASSCGQDMPVETTATGSESWSLVKALY